MVCSIEELCRKDVIDVENGCRVGFVSDAEIQTDNGSLLCLIVSCADKAFNLKRADTIRVCWNDIVVIGKETVLVKNVELPQTADKSSKKVFDLFFK